MTMSVDASVAGLYPHDVHPSCLIPSPSPSLSPSPDSSCSSPASSFSAAHKAPLTGQPLSSLFDCCYPTSPRSSSSSPCTSHGGSSDDRPVPRRMWTSEEHDRFLTALHAHVSTRRRGKTGVRDSGGRLRVGLGRGAARKIAQAIGTRDEAQVRSHAQKYFQQLARRGQDWRAASEERPGARERGRGEASEQ